MKKEIEKVFAIAEKIADYLTSCEGSFDWEELAYSCSNEYGSDWAVFDELYK